MSDATYDLWCFVEGDNAILCVPASLTKTIDRLRVMIKKTGATFFKGLMPRASLSRRCVISSD
jgi:hypothetical protein